MTTKRHLAPWLQWLLVIIAAIDGVLLVSINYIEDWSAFPIILSMFIIFIAIILVLKKWGRGLIDE